MHGVYNFGSVGGREVTCSAPLSQKQARRVDLELGMWGGGKK